MTIGCTKIITSAKRQAIARLMMQAISTEEAVWMTRDILSPMSDLTYKKNMVKNYSSQIFNKRCFSI